MISAAARAILMDCVYLGVPPTSPALMRHYSGVPRHGKDFMQKKTRELKDAGFVKEKKILIGNRIQTICTVTDVGVSYLLELGFPAPQAVVTEAGFSAPLTQQSEQSSNMLDNSLYSKKLLTDEVLEEYLVVEVEVNEVAGWGGMFDSTASDELLAEREANERRKREEYRQQKAEKQKTKLAGRNNVPVSRWSPGDIAHELTYRIGMHWHIAPWQVGMEKFIKALGSNRMKYETNGDIEFKMLELFLEATEFEKFNSADHLCWRFISQFPDLSNKAKAMVRTSDELEEATTQAKKSQEWLYE